MAERFLVREGKDPRAVPGAADDDHLDDAPPPVPAPSWLEDPPMSPAGDGFGPPTAQGRSDD
jgi:hypothetical protein